MINKKCIKLLIPVFIIGSALIVSVVNSQKALAAYPPDNIKTILTNSCISPGPGESYATGFIYPDPSTVLSSAGNTNLYAAAHICAGSYWWGVLGVQLSLNSYSRYAGTGNLHISTPQLFSKVNTDSTSFSQASAPVRVTFDSLSQGWNCWYFSMTMTIDGPGTWGSYTTGRNSLCIEYEPPPPPDPSVKLTVNGSSSPKPIEEGGIISVEWVPDNASSCSASGDWTGNKSVSGGTENNSDDALVIGKKTYKIECDGASGSTPASATVSILVTRKPYLRVYGGDVVSGIGFEPSCTKNSSSQISAYNRGSSGGYGGAGAQFGVQAYGAVDQFVSAMLRGSNPTPPKGLTFANTSGTYGASFGDAPCIRDYSATLAAYHSNAPAIPTGVIFGTSGNWDPDLPFGNPGYGYRQRTGDLTLVAGTIESGTHRVIYVDGNVAITGNVFYAGYGSQDQIPSFYLIVRGNIYIQGPVSNLDGVFVAQPKADGTGGVIYTCASGFAPAPTNQLYANCSNKLTINGAFIANQVKFLRTVGTQSLSNANEASNSANIAEVFNFSPELWLTSPGLVTGGTIQLDSITSLPPVL